MYDSITNWIGRWIDDVDSTTACLAILKPWLAFSPTVSLIQLNLCFMSNTKLNSRWIKGLNMKCKAINQIEFIINIGNEPS